MDNAHGGTNTVADGQPLPEVAAVEPEITTGEPSQETVTTGEEPKSAVEGLPEDWNADTMADRFKDYQSLQREFGTRNETLKGFEEANEKMAAFGGSDQLMQWASYLQNNPRFAEFIQSEQSREDNEHLGLDGDMDEDTRSALELVRKEIDIRADAKIQEALKSRVDPIADRYKEEQLESNLGQMDAKYGDNWRDVQDEMAKLAEGLPLEMQDAPTLDVLEDLYWKAIRTTGKMDGMMAKMHEQKITAKKAMSSERPSSNAGQTGLKKAMSVEEAFNQAKQNAT